MTKLQCVCLLMLGAALAACADPTDSSWSGAPLGDGSVAADGRSPGFDAAGYDGGAPFDATDPIDAPLPPAMPEGGLPSNPGFVVCGTSSCDLSTQVCCLPYDQSSKSPYCAAPGSCVSAEPMACDEPEDCSSGQVCCLTTKYQNAVTTACSSPLDCYYPGAQMCRQTSDCKHFGPCVAQQCGKNFIESCGGEGPSLCN